MATVNIGTVQDLIDFGNGVYGYGSSSDWLDVYLTADLDFADYDDTYSWAGCGGNYYCSFNGQGHKIDNIQYTGASDWGFFKEDGGHIYVKNLDLTNMYIVSGGNVGGLCISGQSIAGTTYFRNCHLSGQLESYGSIGDVAGICWDKYKTLYISYCSFSGVLKNVNGSLFSILNNASSNTYRSVSQCMGVCDMITTSGYPFGISGWSSYVVNSEYRGNMKISSGASNIFPFIHGAGGNATNCICVIESGSNGGFHNDATGSTIYNNCYIDSDELSAAGISIGPFTGATTAQLQDETWLKGKGFAL